MNSDSKVRKIGGARKAAEPISASALASFAEKVILTDKQAALKAQNSVTDLTARSNDSSKVPQISSLSELCGTTGAVRLNSSNEDPGAEKLVEISSLRRKP